RTANTIFDLPSPPKEKEQDPSAYPYPYLYPTDIEPNYATVRISSIKDNNSSYNAITSFVANFKLYDVTRRALNCLTILLDTATNDPDAQAKDYEMNLAAYLAGRSLAALSWNVSVAIVPLESTLTPEQQKDTGMMSALQKKVQTIWQNTFNDRDVNSLQHQIT